MIDSLIEIFCRYFENGSNVGVRSLLTDIDLNRHGWTWLFHLPRPLQSAGCAKILWSCYYN
jgi:hypothetical protein